LPLGAGIPTPGDNRTANIFRVYPVHYCLLSGFAVSVQPVLLARFGQNCQFAPEALGPLVTQVSLLQVGNDVLERVALSGVYFG